jgi:DNA-binding MarR family transcriptional regulator
MIPPATEADALTVAGRLRPVLLQLNRHLRRELRDLGVTSTQVSLLAAIRSNPDIGLTDLAAREQLTTPTLNGHINRLEQAGLVERSRGQSTDRRRIALAVTEQASELLDTVRTRRTAWLAERLQALEPEELAAIDAAVEPLRRLLERAP